MLDLGEGDKVEDLDEELTGDVGLVVGESLDGDKDGWGSDDKGVQGIKGGGREEGKRWGVRSMVKITKDAS